MFELTFYNGDTLEVPRKDLKYISHAPDGLVVVMKDGKAYYKVEMVK